jgi:hypothetical protein
VPDPGGANLLSIPPAALSFRRIVWPDGRSIDGGVVGRIYRMTSTGRETWQWTQIGQRHRRTVQQTPEALRA